MRRIFMVLVMATRRSSDLAPADLAINNVCSAIPCSGTTGTDKLRERTGNGLADNISGLGGKDTVRSDLYGADRDVLNGGPGNDTLNARDRDSKDTLNGGPGNDRCRGDLQDEFRGCETQVETG
jgi:hypothetical protein